MANNPQSGQASPSDLFSPYNSLAFVIWSILSKIAGATVVKVMGVTNSGGVTPVGTVDIMPMVNQMDGNWNAVPHATIFKCPYFRLQGGADAIILDPKVGDIGIAIFADRDISNVIATKAVSNPGSRRMYDMADGLYIGGVLNGTPTQYVEFSTAGIKIVSPTAIEMDAPDIKLVAPTVEINASSGVTITTPTVQVNGAIVATGNVTAGSIDLETHHHTGVQTGSGNTGGPAG